MIQVNGVETDSLPVTDRGLLYGDGVWETIGVIGGQPQLLGWHLERMQHGIQALAIDEPDWEHFRREILNSCDAQKKCILKLIVTRGSGSRGYNPQSVRGQTRILQTSEWVPYPAGYAGQGIRLTLCETRLAQQPRLAGFKHLNRLEQVLARAEFGNDFQEGLVRDYAGNVVEGTMSNLFVIDTNGGVHTPALGQCGVAGIMRRFIIQKLENIGVQCHIHTLGLREIKQAQALFMTNSLIGLWPVREFSGKYYKIPLLIRELQESIKTLP